VTLTTTAATTLTSPPSSAGSATAPLVGSDARDAPTTAAFPSGCSATARMTAGTTRTSCPRTVPIAAARAISSAAITDACPSEFTSKFLVVGGC